MTHHHHQGWWPGMTRHQYDDGDESYLATSPNDGDESYLATSPDDGDESYLATSPDDGGQRGTVEICVQSSRMCRCGCC